ncbi:MAG: response regulator transcription factor [Bacteroidetes bacterium]|nr:response regulator transcription factor [Bacteroidota bacterium]
MRKIKILIADNSYLIRKGLQSIIDQVEDFSIVGEAEKAEELSEKLLLNSPDVLIMDYSSRYFCLDDISIIREHFPMVNILAITSLQPKSIVSKSIEYGITSHLWNDCGKEEIIESIYSTSMSKKFLCGKIVDLLMEQSMLISSNVSCSGVKISEREIQILQLIADGLPSKQIADKLFISVHTVTTHRKNLMSKLNVNNRASLVMFAIRENLIGTSGISISTN